MEVSIGIICGIGASLASAIVVLWNRNLKQQEKVEVLLAETKELTGATLEKIKERLGGSLIYTQEGSESAAVESNTTIDFYFAKKDGERKGVAIIDVEPGKWGPVEFIVAMDVKGTVKSVRVLSYEEIRGRPIARTSFMNQYRDKNVNSTLTVGKDIVGISGATISSRSATFTVKKALVIYEEVYLKKGS